VKNGHYKTIHLHNAKGNKVGYLGAHDAGNEDGQGIIFLYDGDGKQKVQLGSYGYGLEKGQSLIGLHDKQSYLRFLMRLHGANDSPTIIMKNSQGADTLVIGLDGQTQEPYIKYTDKTGQIKNLIESSY
jgi:hypothetical protein